MRLPLRSLHLRPVKLVDFRGALHALQCYHQCLCAKRLAEAVGAAIATKTRYVFMRELLYYPQFEGKMIHLCIKVL